MKKIRQTTVEDRKQFPESNIVAETKTQKGGYSRTNWKQNMVMICLRRIGWENDEPKPLLFQNCQKRQS